MDYKEKLNDLNKKVQNGDWHILGIHQQDNVTGQSFTIDGYPELDTSTRLIKQLGKESYEVNNRLKKLKDFLNSDKVDNVSAKQIDLMHLQKYAMQSYRDILIVRMNELKEHNKKG